MDIATSPRCPEFITLIRNVQLLFSPISLSAAKTEMLSLTILWMIVLETQ